MQAMEEVTKRKADPRIFERQRDQMIDQFIRFAGLTVLPGTSWINNDIPQNPGTSKNWVIELSMRRFFGSVFASGILQRHLIKQERAVSFEDASERLAIAFFRFLEMWRDRQ